MRHIFDVIREYDMIEPGMRVMAGVSGGADSVCLLYVLNEYRRTVPFELLAVHVEHGLRGQESLEDARFTQELCRRLDVPCCVEHVDVRAAVRAQGLSEEEAARALRYEAFRKNGARWRADCLAVAHNRGDQAETVLWNLVRGSGLRGLCGMRPVRRLIPGGTDEIFLKLTGNQPDSRQGGADGTLLKLTGNQPDSQPDGADAAFLKQTENLHQGDADAISIIRPLLYTDRKEIEEILRSAGLSWRTDRTNLEPDYTRNRIRLSLLPQMERDLNAQAGLHIAQAAQKLQKLEAYLERQTDAAAGRCFVEPEAGSAAARRHLAEPGTVLRLTSFFAEEPLIQEELLKRALVMCGGGRGLKDVGAVHLDMLMQLAKMDCGRECHLPGGVRAVREDGILRFTKGGRTVHGQSTTGAYKSKHIKEAPDERSSILQYDLPVPGTLIVEENAGVASSAFMREQFSASSSGTSLSSVSAGICEQAPSSPRRVRVTTDLLVNHSALRNEICDEKKYTKLLSYDTIKCNVQLRTRRPGDYLVINDQGGRRKLKDYLIDRKIPRDRRDEVWLVADGSHILWVVGYRISAAAKVRENTEKVIRIQIEEEQS